jgi:ribokinase
MIVVFGSINVDVLVPVPHLPTPGETVLGSDHVIAPGGKGGNQALAAARTGAAVTMIGAVGRDPLAEIALSQLRRAGAYLSLVREVDRPTGCAIITVDPSGENQIAVASGANLLVASTQVPERLLDMKTVLLLQREVSPAENAAVIARANARGARIVLSLAPAGSIEPARLDELDFLIANENEVARFSDDLPGLARQLRQGLIVTQGAEGAVALLRDGSSISVPALSIDPVDTTGAGDTFAGVFAAGLDRQLPVDTALRRASAAAGLACLAVGAQAAMPNRAAIETAIEKLQP